MKEKLDYASKKTVKVTTREGEAVKELKAEHGKGWEEAVEAQDMTAGS